ncbi:MAG: hypothetical protein HY918_05615 [Candidatus Doudnabacteria bacterium]|nr:hypothetical protein [Candidatus Doudnabacteria bacterium]
MKNAFKVVLLTCLLIPTLAFAAGIQVYPSRMDFELKPGQQDAKFLTISNPTSDIQLFEVRAEGFSQLIRIEPASFTLESGEKKNVQISVKSPLSGQTIAAELTLTGKPLTENSLSIGAGVKIPVIINSQESEGVSKNKPAILALMILVFIGLLYYSNKRDKLNK